MDTWKLGNGLKIKIRIGIGIGIENRNRMQMAQDIQESKVACLVTPKPRAGVVVGTFEDLSQEEKTKAFLQLLEYRLKVKFN